MKIVILANGSFPTHSIPLGILKEATFIVSCDGATDKLLQQGFEPQLIIGDLDSVDKQTLAKYKDIAIRVKRQDNTDLMKALDWCLAEGISEVSILGATGDREDHTLGNLFAITFYADKLKIQLYTDTGTFVALPKSQELKTHKGQQVSLFPQPLEMKITTRGLKFPLKNEALPTLHSGTLNEAEGNSIRLEFTTGVLLVYRTYF